MYKKWDRIKVSIIIIKRQTKRHTQRTTEGETKEGKRERKVYSERKGESNYLPHAPINDIYVDI